ncbi:ABC transporter substrate-binding protein [Clostridium hydrogenum]|uniref:ABC transporter substrate-binding protein n=1 Tax=Clostridium hydrogenum TaxID=2855764 RepID=UPI001F38A536|nr:extracellular solute-binding protein [Clostridium hydrogenum]
MVKSKIVPSIIVSFAILSSVLVGCKSNVRETVSKSSEKNITIEWETNRTDVAGTTLKKLADDYHKLHTNITIKIEAEKDSDGVLKTKAAGGELPDLSYVIGTMKKTDYPKYYEDLSDLGYNKDNLYCYNAGLQDGRLYCLSLSINYMGVFYNKQSFKKAGITSTPKTIDDFYTDCEKLKAVGITPFASNFKDGWPLAPYADTHLLAQAQTGDDNFENSFETKNPFDDPNGLLYGFKFMRSMKEKGYLEKDLMSTSWDNSKKDMAQGKTAMTYIGTWFTPQLLDNGARKEDIGMFPFPGTKAIIMSGNGGMCIAKTSKHKKETKEFLKWLYKDNKVQNAMKISTPIKGEKSHIVGVNELLSAGLPILEEKSANDKIIRIWQESGINLQQALQDYMQSSNPEKVIDDINDRFAAVRSSIK